MKDFLILYKKNYAKSLLDVKGKAETHALQEP